MSTKYYGEIGQGRLDSDPEDVVASVFDDLETIESYKYPFIVHAFEPREIILYENYFLESIYENLDDEYGDPDGSYTEPTDKVKAKAKELIEVIKSEYTSYMCETTGEKIEYSQKDVLEIVGLSECKILLKDPEEKNQSG